MTKYEIIRDLTQVVEKIENGFKTNEIMMGYAFVLIDIIRTMVSSDIEGTGYYNKFMEQMGNQGNNNNCDNGQCKCGNQQNNKIFTEEEVTKLLEDDDVKDAIGKLKDIL
jgi:hypothetical protein